MARCARCHGCRSGKHDRTVSACLCRSASTRSGGVSPQCCLRQPATRWTRHESCRPPLAPARHQLPLPSLRNRARPSECAPQRVPRARAALTSVGMSHAVCSLRLTRVREDQQRQHRVPPHPLSRPTDELLQTAWQLKNRKKDPKNRLTGAPCSQTLSRLFSSSMWR